MSMKQSLYSKGKATAPEVLAQLDQVQKEASRAPAGRAHKAYQQKQADASANSPELQASWFNSMKTVIREVDEETRLIPQHADFRFLDIGCCPGGFSSHILLKSPQSHGVGMSLPVESGGHDFHLEEHLRPRLELHWFDITQYQLGYAGYPGLKPLPFEDTKFDLIILDAHPLRGSASGPMCMIGDRLFVSSLCIGLKCIAMGGTFLVKLAKVDRIFTSTIIYMLDVLSMQLMLWKPVSMHATQDTFYAVAKGFSIKTGSAAYLATVLHGFQALWEALMLDEDRCLRNGDLDFVVSKKHLEGPYKGRLEQLSHPIWQVQLASLKGWKEVERL